MLLCYVGISNLLFFPLFFFSSQGVVSVHRRHCQTTAHCDSGCWRITKLTCGSDGKLYNNGCQMQRKNCGRHVYDVPVPFCLNKLYRTDCPLDCSQEEDGKVGWGGREEDRGGI